MSTPNKILVTGGSGRLGTALGALGCTALGRADLDITSPESLASAFETHHPALVINAAAYTAVDRAESEPDQAFTVNRDGACNVAKACARAQIPLIHISTDCVFGDSDPAHMKTENQAPSALSVYGRSKQEGEAALLDAIDRRTCITRVSWLFDEDEDTFIAKMLSLASKHTELQIVNDAYGRPTATGDLAVALLALAERMTDGLPVPEILHLGPQNPVSRFGWAKRLFAKSAALGGPAPQLAPCSSDTFQEPARRPRGLVLDVATANALVGRMPDWQIASDRAVARLLALD